MNDLILETISFVASNKKYTLAQRVGLIRVLLNKPLPTNGDTTE